MSIAAVGTQMAAPALRGAPALAACPALGDIVPAARPGERVRLVLRRRAVLPASVPSAPIEATLASDQPLVSSDGCDVLVGHMPLSPAARLALLTWLPPSPRELAAVEAGPFHDEPWSAVELLLRPPTIWATVDALAVRRSLAERPAGSERVATVERAAADLVGNRQLLRLRAALARLRSQLPFAEFPLASALVKSGCAALEQDTGKATAVSAAQLVRYATSAGLRE